MSVFYLRYWLKRNAIYLIFLVFTLFGTILYVKLSGTSANVFENIFAGNMTSDNGWFQIIRRRTVEVLVLVAFAHSPVIKPVCLVFIAYFGCMWGMLESLSVAEFGIFGIIYVIVSLLPQYIIYAMAIYIYFLAFFAGKIKEQYIVIALSVVILLMAVGTAVEITVNPQLLRLVNNMLA